MGETSPLVPVDTRTMTRPGAGEATSLLPVSAEVGAGNLPWELLGLGDGTGSSRRRGPGAAAGTLPGLRRAAVGADDKAGEGREAKHYK